MTTKLLLILSLIAAAPALSWAVEKDNTSNRQPSSLGQGPVGQVANCPCYQCIKLTGHNSARCEGVALNVNPAKADAIGHEGKPPEAAKGETAN